ncbi:MAG: hypothetical protein HY754_01715 [Nitrospirae bacterium]|nr:hypothetical protein [Nitrospirota bacterium]
MSSGECGQRWESKMKKFPLAITFIFLSLFILSADSFADTFSVSLPAGTAVTMGNYDYEILPFTITNNGPTKNIRNITFTIDTNIYNFSTATVPPSGWCIKSISSGSIEFALQQGGGGCSSGATASQITPGNSVIFNITLTGPGDGAIPAAASDQTDTLTNATVSAEGGFSLSGSLPTWTRKSLAITLSASPSSVGVGDTITVTMNVTNRSTASQSGITSNPNPPSSTGASVTPIGVATYGSTSSTINPSPTTLSNNINASVTTINVSSTSDYLTSGRIKIDNELIDYGGKTGTSFTGCTREVGGTTAASHNNGTLVYSQNTSPFTLTSGESSTITWTFSADATGTVYFTSSAQNAGATATSKSVSSNIVVIGDFTATVSVTPLNVISGQTVTVKMTVKNNGTSSLTSITPTLTPGGTATKTLSSGPSPGSPYGPLGSGESVTFEWIYTITGSVNQTYFFSGYATSSGPTTNTSTSETGSISQYSVTVTPTTIATGTTSNTTFTWTVYNRGGATVKQIQISIPSPLTSNCASTKGWGYVSNTPPANWTATTTGTPVSSVTFTANNPVDTYGIPIGGSKDFKITFNCVPQVTSDTAYNFPVLITDKNNNQTTINTTITVTAYLLTLTVYNEDCTSDAPASKPANGDSRYCFKATLTSGGSPAPGKTITYSITSGPGTFSPSPPLVTNGSGVVTFYLISPCSTADVSTTVKAELGGSLDTYDTETVQFTGVGGGNLSYVSGSLTPASVTTGYSSGFNLQLRNCGTSPLTIQTTNTTIAIRQNSADTFTLNTIDINPIPAGSTATLTFNSKAVSSAIYQCYPLLTVNAGAGYTDTFSYYKTPRGDSLTDMVTVNNGTTCPSARVRILDWREVVQ